MVFWAYFSKMVIYIFFYRFRVTFSLKMLLWRGIQGASKNPLRSLQLHGVLELWPPEVSILMENLRGGRPKIAISRNFWHFSNFDLFLKGDPGASKTPSGISQLAVVPEIWPPEVSISLENIREGQTKIAIFSVLGFQTL